MNLACILREEMSTLPACAVVTRGPSSWIASDTGGSEVADVTDCGRCSERLGFATGAAWEIAVVGLFETPLGGELEGSVLEGGVLAASCRRVILAKLVGLEHGELDGSKQLEGAPAIVLETSITSVTGSDIDFLTDASEMAASLGAAIPDGGVAVETVSVILLTVFLGFKGSVRFVTRATTGCVATPEAMLIEAWSF